MPDPLEVQRMFGRIAGHYDLLNRLLSAGVDQRWRRAVAREAGELAGRRALDVCCGTGDLALLLAAGGARVLALDFTSEMLALARAKLGAAGPQCVRGDALELPVADAAVDVLTIAFGLRNVAERGRSLAEMLRVLRPGGRALVLEFSQPRGALLARAYRAYFTRVLPLVGRLVSRHDDAYAYLPRTVLAWPTPAELEREMRELGFANCRHRLLSRGIACLHVGERAR
jgi:demethylmenaquinone methyltransferase/2-methoxy-6-polyprenyl-1,4-benzoquinol methylase